MSAIKSLLISARNVVVAHSRRRRIDALAQQGLVPHFAAFYHRVADTHPNGWTLSRDGFRRHLDYFQSIGTVVDLAEAQRRVRCANSIDRSITITFDDGYADNLDFAIPEILDRKIPCTYFVTTQNFLKNLPFAHDVKEGVSLAVHNAKQIRELSDAGIEIGCHTRNHVDFANVTNPAEIDSEIRIAKDELEQIIGRRVRYFAFPFGLEPQLTDPAIQSVHQAGFDGFCSAYGGYNLIGRDDFHLRRFHGDPEFPRLANWLSFDERKVRHEPSVCYDLRPVTPSDHATVFSAVSTPTATTPPIPTCLP